MLARLSGYRTYLALWLPVLGTLVALLTHKAPPEIGWLAFAALVARAVDQTFMRLGVAASAPQRPIPPPKTPQRRQRRLGAWAPFLLLPILLAPTSACTSPQYVSKSALRPALTMVVNRHDAYVKKDPELTDAQRRRYLRTTTLLLKLTEDASE